MSIGRRACARREFRGELRRGPRCVAGSMSTDPAYANRANACRFTAAVGAAQMKTRATRILMGIGLVSSHRSGEVHLAEQSGDA
jgi:hypothetical protein